MKFERTIRILLVEDSPSHAVMFEASLKKAYSAPFEIERAVSLLECFERMDRANFDLVVLDLGLPESRELDTLKNFFKVKGPDNPVIVLTADSDDLIGEEALRIGAIDFLTKGNFTADQLARTVRYALERWRQRVELDEAKRNLESFAHVAAHDLKSPVASISIYAQMLKKRALAREVDKEEIEFLDHIEDFTNQAVSLVDSLLNFCVLGEKSIEPEVVSLEKLAHQAVANLTASMVKFEAEVNVGSMPASFADSSLLIHVFQNLIANGIKYHRGIRPVLKVSAIHCGTSIRVAISDNGRGIDGQYLNRIFEPFKRLSGADDADGVGLGLTICKRIVDAHLGKIWAESEQGKGSTFYLELPAVPKSEPAPERDLLASYAR